MGKRDTVGSIIKTLAFVEILNHLRSIFVMPLKLLEVLSDFALAFLKIQMGGLRKQLKPQPRHLLHQSQLHHLPRSQRLQSQLPCLRSGGPLDGLKNFAALKLAPDLVNTSHVLANEAALLLNARTSALTTNVVSSSTAVIEVTVDFTVLVT